jgi:hypothetical protein
MISGRNGQMRAKTTRDHGRHPGTAVANADSRDQHKLNRYRLDGVNPT